MAGSGLAASSLNIVVYFVAFLALAIINAMALRCIRQLTRLRLQACKEAPVLYETYASTFGCFRAIPKLIRSRCFGLTVVAILLALTIPATLAFEYGGDSSEKCRPILLKTEGICAKPLNPTMNFGTLGTVIFHTKEWNDVQLLENPIYEGLRRNINGKEYFGPDKRRDFSRPIVIQGCKVGHRSILPPNSTLTYIPARGMRRYHRFRLGDTHFQLRGPYLTFIQLLLLYLIRR